MNLKLLVSSVLIPALLACAATAQVITFTNAHTLNVGPTTYGAEPFFPTLNNGVLKLTSALPSGSDGPRASSFWIDTPVYIGSFTAHFVMEDLDNNSSGVCFVLQNSAATTNACGDPGSGLGVAEFPGDNDAITNSFELEMDVWTDNIGIDTNGVTCSSECLGGASEFGLGDFGAGGKPQDFWITYTGTVLTITYSNEVTHVTATKSSNVSSNFMQQAVGGSSTAFIGFTAGTYMLSVSESGGVYTMTDYPSDTITISDFSYTPIYPIGPPQFNPLPSTTYSLAGNSLVLSVGAETGAPPFTNAWYANGILLTNGPNISGATTTTLTISNGLSGNTGSYAFYASNAAGSANTSGRVVVYSVPALTDTGAYTLNVGPSVFWNPPFFPAVNNGVLQLTSALPAGSDTNADAAQATSFWLNQPYYIGAFKAHFVFEALYGLSSGVCFVLQNSAATTNACGDPGVALGVAEFPDFGDNDAIGNSFEVEMDLLEDKIGIDTNGVACCISSPTPDLDGQNLGGTPEFSMGDFGTGGQPQDFWISYLGTMLTITYSNEVSHVTATTNINVGANFMQQAVGGRNTAYIGFTAGTYLIGETYSGGGVYTTGYEGSDTLLISQFSFTPAVSLSAKANGGGGQVLEWPAGVGGYVLQSSTNLASGWSTLPVAATINSNNMWQYVVPITGKNQFYRLMLAP